MGFLNKKNKDDGEESSRLALFGSRSKTKSPATPANNPYAQPNVPPDPYTQAKMKAGIIQAPEKQGSYSNGQQPGGYGGATAPGLGPQPSPYGGNGRGYSGPQEGFNTDNRYGSSGAPQGTGGYGPNRLGNEKGYGAPNQGGNPYASANPYAGAGQPSSQARSGGYGGLGPTNDDFGSDSNRDALFGGARDRVQQSKPGGPPGYEYNPDQGSDEQRSYGAYGDRQLTAEEEEEEDIEATKQEIRFMKQQDVASTRNALQAAAMAEETGRNTLARLGAQGERIHNTDRNLDIGHNAINIAEDKSKELKTLNRSMFAVHVNNPFTAKERRIRDEEKILARHQLERDQREATREAAFQSTSRMNQNFKGLEKGQGNLPKASLADRAKYQFEADSDDDRMEDEIDRNIDDLGGAAQRLNTLARAMGQEADAQNAQLLKVQAKSDKLDDRFHLQTERLKRIR